MLGERRVESDRTFEAPPETDMILPSKPHQHGDTQFTTNGLNYMYELVNKKLELMGQGVF